MAEKQSRKILNISLPLSLYREVAAQAEKEFRTKGEFAREALRQYLEHSKRWESIRNLGQETAEQFQISSEEEVERIVHEERGVTNS